MEKEEQLFRKRMTELAQTSFQRDVPIHTDFLNLYEQTIFQTMSASFPPVRYVMTGGYEPAERKIVCFLPSYEEELRKPPIACLLIEPLQKKFAEDLTHRDFLGAVMNLGIERDKTGDILIRDGQCYFMCMEDMAAYIAGELHTVRHTQVSCRPASFDDPDISPRFERVEGSVASERLDNILALAYRLSRAKAVPYIEGERVFINGRLTASNSAALRSGDVVSVRGLGRFIYRGAGSRTKKGRLYVALDKYC